MATDNLFINKSTPLVHAYKVAEHFKSTTKAIDTLFDGKPEKWPTFEDHLIREAQNPTIGWSKDTLTLGFKFTGQDPEINLLKSYFDIPEHIISALTNDLKNAKRDDISNIDRKLYKRNVLKKKLRNCLTPAFCDDIEESMPEGTNSKDCWIYFFHIISRTFPDKEVHTDIIRDCITELKTTKSNSME
jgi:hypothetical protein